MMIRQQIVMGIIIVGLGAVGIHKSRLILEETRKGRRIVELFGMTYAPTVWRALMAAVILFGLLLACGIIRPIQW